MSIFDGGRTGTLTKFLSERGIDSVDTIVVSHADADHFSGILRLMRNSDVKVQRVFVNPDNRDSDLWDDFRSEMASFRALGVDIYIELTHVHPGTWQAGRTRFEVLAPLQEDAAGTVAGTTAAGESLNSNRMSAVVRVLVDDVPKVLLPGDIDGIGFQRLMERGADVRAEVLVFPHHGGLPGDADPAAFAERLMRAVEPRLVIFSNGRGQHNTPRPDIVSAVLRTSPNVRVACTQLSEHCAEFVPLNPEVLHDVVAQGRSRSACCAGTVEISLHGALSFLPDDSVHDRFINRHTGDPLCRRR